MPTEILTVGRRIADDAVPQQPGDYARQTLPGTPGWLVCNPAGQVETLSNDGVEEHTDGSISVAGTIDHPTPGAWRGTIDHGIWRAA